MCESVEMEKESPERETWECHGGNALTWDTCTACGAKWRFWQVVIEKKTVIKGYQRGGAAKDRTPGRCETCHVMWKEAANQNLKHGDECKPHLPYKRSRWQGGHDGDEPQLQEEYDELDIQTQLQPVVNGLAEAVDKAEAAAKKKRRRR